MKKTIIALTVVAALAIPTAAFAATSKSSIASNIRGFCGVGVSTAELTEQQKADLQDSFNKMIELKKETINKMVQNGSITKEQGDLEMKRIEDMVKYHSENGYGLGMMNGYGPNMMNSNFRGSGMMRRR